MISLAHELFMSEYYPNLNQIYTSKIGFLSTVHACCSYCIKEVRFFSSYIKQHR